MKLLSALRKNQLKAFFIWFPLSLGLSVSVWADETLDKARWASTMNTFYIQSCAEFTLPFEDNAQQYRTVISGNLYSFLIGFNYALYDTYRDLKFSNMIDDSTRIPYVDISPLASIDQFLVLDTIVLKCRQSPEEPLIKILSIWLDEYRLMQQLKQ